MDDPLANAISQARREERIAARLDTHEKELRALRDSHASTMHSLAELRATATRIELTIAEQGAIAKAFAAKAATTLTQRQLYVALGMFLAALVALVLGVGVGVK